MLSLRGLWLVPLLPLIGAGRLGLALLVAPRPATAGEGDVGFFLAFYIVVLPLVTLCSVLLGASLGWRPRTG